MGFPGGAIELGETPQLAAIREVKEETGLDVEVGSLIGIYTDCNMEYPNGDKAHSIMIAYELDAVGGELYCDQEETFELKYFSLDDTPELFCKQHEELLNDIRARQRLMGITYTNIITQESANSIRAAVGFRRIHPEQLQASLDGSALIVAAYDQSRAVGMARLIWDGGSVALIRDIIVVPDYQMQGIEAELIRQIFDFLNSKLKPGFGIQVDVMAWNKQEKIYEGLGFQVSTPQRRGIPMHICLTNQIELTDEMFQQ